jgi:hypothetical protein
MSAGIFLFKLNGLHLTEVAIYLKALMQFYEQT